MTSFGDVERFFHINVNCSDFDRSLAFYETVGFRVLLDFEDAPPPRRTFGEIGLGPVLNLPADCDGRAALLTLSDDPRAMRLDLIEWRVPQEEAPPRRTLAQPGMARICLATRDALAVHARLQAAGYDSYSAPVDTALGGSLIRVFCCEDPDGTVIEFMQFLGPETPSV
ncbi:VOC family protein [Chachezhania sediminis]|uniref:VOC family protein n=1 Tax=Chachezhania sediminis TaxID=2599291 RepID=UPI00131AE551|nr:VOC family protein [Chachezhania sediminis]